MKKYLIPIGIAALLIIGVLVLSTIVAMIPSDPPVPKEVLEARVRRAAEAKRWASLSPEQQAAELNARRVKEAKEKEESERALAEKSRAEFQTSARYFCRSAITSILHDPDSAKFERTGDWSVKEIDERTLQVLAILRAKNAFGAYRLGAYICEVRNDGTGNLRIVRLEQQ